MMNINNNNNNELKIGQETFVFSLPMSCFPCNVFEVSYNYITRGKPTVVI